MTSIVTNTFGKIKKMEPQLPSYHACMQLFKPASDKFETLSLSQFSVEGSNGQNQTRQDSKRLARVKSGSGSAIQFSNQLMSGLPTVKMNLRNFIVPEGHLLLPQLGLLLGLLLLLLLLQPLLRALHRTCCSSSSNSQSKECTPLIK